MGEINISKSHPWSDGLNDVQISPYLQELQAFAGQSDNYETASSTLQKYLRIPINSSQVKRVTKCYSEILIESEFNLQSVQEEKIIELKESLEDSEVVYAMLDGGMIQTREGEENNDWKEVKLGRIFRSKAIYEVDKHHNWLNDSIYCGHLGGYKSFLEKFEPLTDILDDLGERFVFVADGASWIWRWITEAYPNATQILDFYHGVEHLAKFAKVHFKNKEASQKWLGKQRVGLLNDRIKNIITEIESLKCSKSADKERKKLLTYLENNEHRMLYKTFMNKGIKIGSGAIESAHRTVIQKRMKQSGQRWSVNGAQDIINLRLLNINQKWSVIIDLIKDEEVTNFKKSA